MNNKLFHKAVPISVICLLGGCGVQQYTVVDGENAIEPLQQHFASSGGVEVNDQFEEILGAEEVRVELGPGPGFSYALVIDRQGILTHELLAPDGFSSRVTPHLSEDDTRRAAGMCKERWGDSEEYNMCISRVLSRVILDCDLSFTEEDCEVHCWFFGGACRD